ncbi:hypothetical protein P7C73_g1901, partial [Tremellales sp. Uapishka_1]
MDTRGDEQHGETGSNSENGECGTEKVEEVRALLFWRPLLFFGTICITRVQEPLPAQRGTIEWHVNQSKLPNLTLIMPPITHSNVWQGVISAPIEEGELASGVAVLNGMTTDKSVPVKQHVQLLLYLVLNPLQHNVKSLKPISVLYKLLSQCRPSDIAHTIPSYPIRNHDPPRWLDWEPRGADEKRVHRLMGGCRSRGIWSLLWIVQQRSKVKEEDDEEEVGDKVVSERGWILLGWLLDFWEKDERESGRTYSPLFLSQLPKITSTSASSTVTPHDDATSPFAVIHSGYREDTLTTKAEVLQHRNSASRLFSLMIHACLPKPPPFHPPSFLLSALQLFRSLPLDSLSNFLFSLSPEIEASYLPHFLTIYLEDIAGIRTTKNDERRRSPQHSDFQPSTHPFPPPSVAYFTSSLLPLSLPVGKVTEASVPRVMFLKIRLFVLMMRQYPPETDTAWMYALAKDPTWKERSMASLLRVKETEDAYLMITALIDRVESSRPGKAVQ